MPSDEKLLETLARLKGWMLFDGSWYLPMDIGFFNSRDRPYLIAPCDSQNPLTNDAQLMALARECNLQVSWPDKMVCGFHPGRNLSRTLGWGGTDPDGTEAQCIVMAAIVSLGGRVD